VHIPVSLLAYRGAVLDTPASSTFLGRVKDTAHMAARVGFSNGTIVFMPGRSFSRAGFSW